MSAVVAPQVMSRDSSSKENQRSLANPERSNIIIHNNTNIRNIKVSLPSSEQTPGGFLAACSKLDLEPNPFEQSFSGLSQGIRNASQVNTPNKTMLPPIAAMASPSESISSTQYPGWVSSLRSGPLSPAMLPGPQASSFDPSFRTGLTPLAPGNFSSTPSTTPATIMAMVSSETGAFANSAVAAPVQTTFVQLPGGNTSTVQRVDQSEFDPNDPATAAASGLFLLSQAHDEMSKREEGARTSTVIGQNERNLNGSSITSSRPNIIQRKSKQEDSSKPVPNRRPSRRKRRDTDELDDDDDDDDDRDEIDLEDEQYLEMDKTSTKRGSSSRKRQEPVDSRTEEEKRKNFLERNRMAALKCRQRKKQWLKNLEQKVEFLTSDNEALQNQAVALREEIIGLKTLLLAHKDCPMTYPNGVVVPKHGSIVHRTIGSAVASLSAASQSSQQQAMQQLAVSAVHQQLQQHQQQ